MQDKHGLLFLGQRSNGLPDEFFCLVLVPGGLGIVCLRCRKDRIVPADVLKLPTEPSPPPEFPVIAIEIPAAVEDDPIDPSGNEAIVPEFSRRLINLKEYLLGDIFGILRVIEQTEAEVQDFVLKAIDEYFEGSVVLFCDSPQQFPVVYRLRNLDFGTPLNQI
jgi:hypothetical protein